MTDCALKWTMVINADAKSDIKASTVKVNFFLNLQTVFFHHRVSVLLQFSGIHAHELLQRDAWPDSSTITLLAA